MERINSVAERPRTALRPSENVSQPRAKTFIYIITWRRRQCADVPQHIIAIAGNPENVYAWLARCHSFARTGAPECVRLPTHKKGPAPLLHYAFSHERCQTTEQEHSLNLYNSFVALARKHACFMCVCVCVMVDGVPYSTHKQTHANKQHITRPRR